MLPLAPMTYRRIDRITGWLVGIAIAAVAVSTLIAWRSGSDSSGPRGALMGTFLLVWGLRLLVRQLDPARTDERSAPGDDGYRGPLEPPVSRKRS